MPDHPTLSMLFCSANAAQARSTARAAVGAATAALSRGLVRSACLIALPVLLAACCLCQ
jgi:hypothetical protein